MLKNLGKFIVFLLEHLSNSNISRPTDFTAFRKLLIPNNDKSKHHKDTSLLENYIHTLTNVNYKEQKLSLVKCIVKRNRKLDTTSLFCSEIVAKILVEMGLLPGHTIVTNYSPKDFSTLATSLNSVLLHGASYSKERRMRLIVPVSNEYEGTELRDQSHDS
jgi:hypothetical protein